MQTTHHESGHRGQGAAQAGRLLALTALLVLGVTSLGAAQIIPDTRRITWQGHVGVAGGIPNVTTIYTNLYPSGEDDGDMIRAAMAYCPSNQVVMLCPGTFTVGGDIDFQRIGSGKVLRGYSPEKTKLVLTNGLIIMRGGQFSENALTNSVDLAADAFKGSTMIELASMPSWVVVGGIYLLDSLDDTNEVYAVGTSENETARGYREIMGAGARGRGQIVKVTARAGNAISVEIPLYDTYRTSFVAQISQCGYDASYVNSLRRSGIENFTIENAYDEVSGNSIKMENAENSWIRNVVVTNCPGGIGAQVSFSYRCEIRDSLFVDSHRYGSGQAYGVALYHLSSACLIENNVFQRLHVATSCQYGASGNVIGYNCIMESKADSGQAPSISTHGVHAYMNLWEGNWCQTKVLFDWSHGSAGYNTVFRNRILGYRSPATLDQCAISIEYYSRHCNVVGNVLGAAGWHNAYLFAPPLTCQDVSKPIYKLGYFVNYGCGFSTRYDTLPVNDTLIAVNWDTVTATNNGLVLNGFATSDVPASLYLPSKPAFFGGSPWPVFNGPAASTSITNLPAGWRYTQLTNAVP